MNYLFYENFNLCKYVVAGRSPERRSRSAVNYTSTWKFRPCVRTFSWIKTSDYSWPHVKPILN